MTTKKAPAGQGEGNDQNPVEQKEERTVRTIIPDMTAGHQTNSVIRFDTDLKKRTVYYDLNVRETDLLRLHFRVARTTARPNEFFVSHFADATDADRANAVEWVRSLASIDVTFVKWKALGLVERCRWIHDRRSWFEYVYVGTPVDDPLVQLELEMMIDLQSGVTR